ncbi:MAG: hypothetical protein AAFU71_11660 [Cyanobacteria bacterium J06632_22]
MRPAKLKSLLTILLSALLLSIGVDDALSAHPQPTVPVTYSTASSKQYISRPQPPSNREYFAFGQAGRDGQHGPAGTAGRNGRNLTIQLTDTSTPQLQQYDVSGEDGSNGSPAQPGEHARACNAPYRPEYSLQGADGGDGGNGGNGGSGGSGGDVDLFYADTDSLKTVTVATAGGRGGQPGAGATGGEGCGCVEPQWTINYCEWEVWRQQRDVDNAEWSLFSRELSACSGVRRVDERENAPTISTRDSQDYRYDLRYQGLTTSQQFFCQAGESGRAGTAGRPGQGGQYGSFRLIPQPNIPQEVTRYTDSLQNLLGRPLQFVKNIWVPRQGLPSLLGPASDVPNDYTYLKSTERPQFRLDWAANEAPTVLGIENVDVTVAVEAFNEQARLTYDIPGTLDYTLDEQDGLNVLTVTGGFSPSRLGLFELVNHTTGVAESELTLTDGGSLRELLQSATLAVSCYTKQSASGAVSADYQFRHSITFDVTRQGVSSGRVAIATDDYTLSLGPVFSPWLKDGYDVKYVIEIQQKTNSGAVYPQTVETAFQV